MAAMEEFSRLYRAKQGRAADDEPFLISADRLACALYYALPLRTVVDPGRLLSETDICSLYQDIIVEEPFFTEPSVRLLYLP